MSQRTVFSLQPYSHLTVLQVQCVNILPGLVNISVAVCVVNNALFVASGACITDHLCFIIPWRLPGKTTLKHLGMRASDLSPLVL